MISSKVPLLVFVAFIILVIAQAVVCYFYPESLIARLIIVTVLLIVCYYVLAQTKGMIEKETECKKDKTIIPDFVSEGLFLLVSFVNILLEILQLFGKAKRGRF